MVLVSGNWRIALAAMAVSVGIFLVLLFTVILPSQNTANQAVQQGQALLHQAAKQLNGASHQVSSGAPAGTSSTATHALNRAAKLANCVAAAGTDTGKIMACQTKYGH